MYRRIIVPYIHGQAVLENLFDTENENTIISLKHYNLSQTLGTVAPTTYCYFRLNNAANEIK
jgi:hypothetical protein